MPKHRLSLLLPKSTRDKLNDLIPGRGKGDLLVKLIREYDGATLEEDTATNSVFPMDEDDVKALDAIQAQNGIRSRNLTMTLLIDLAYDRHNAKKQMRLNVSSPSETVN